LIHPEDEPSGIAFPVIVILFAMLAIVGSLIMTSGHATTTRVWIPPSQATSGWRTETCAVAITQRASYNSNVVLGARPRSRPTF